jgi:prepilin-type N-terminal cleavage/methylation domain-containing protein
MKQARGFTLIELAIVLVIMTILIGGLAVPLSAQIQARRIAETRADMRAIQDALIGYAMSKTAGQPYLPCPDDGSGAEIGDEGTRDGNGLCLSTRGLLPWRTLGVDDADAWGNRYTYAVVNAFANSNGFNTTASGNLNIHANSTTCAGTPLLFPDVAAVIVSHGPNGRGAQNKSGGTPLTPANVPANERANLVTPSAPCGDEDFVSLTPPNNDFDDLVVWLHPNILKNRLCQNGCPLPP